MAASVGAAGAPTNPLDARSSGNYGSRSPRGGALEFRLRSAPTNRNAQAEVDAATTPTGDRLLQAGSAGQT
jgi:hypothetical protein